jgi:glycosyltransferase involved in cell wall biosynthesis
MFHDNTEQAIYSKVFAKNNFVYYRKLTRNSIVKKISAVVAATPHISDRFLEVNKNSIDINNYPKSGEISYNDNWQNRDLAIGYIGGIFRTRGILETLEAINGTDIKLILAGNFSPAELENECKAHPGWKNVDFRGYLDRKGINTILGQVRAGMVILEATPSYLVSLPVKMFEYMAAGFLLLLPIFLFGTTLWMKLVLESVLTRQIQK